jgi:hypothetical protein
MGEQSFEEVQRRLAEQFLQEAGTMETDEELGTAFLDFVLQRERLRHRLEGPGPEQEKVDRQTLARLYHQTELSSEYSVAESVFKRLAKDPSHAIRHLKEAAEALSARQTSRARSPRPRSYSSITRLINDIVANDLTIPARKVQAELLLIDGIVLLDDEIRNLQDGDSVKQGNLPSRVSDAKRRAKKQSAEPG